jgi:hypothetical protein
MSFALSRMLDGTSDEEALLAILYPLGNDVALILWMLFVSMVLRKSLKELVYGGYKQS